MLNYFHGVRRFCFIIFRYEALRYLLIRGKLEDYSFQRRLNYV